MLIYSNTYSVNAESLMGLCIVLKKFSVFFLLVKNHFSYDCILLLHEMILSLKIVSLNPTFPTTYLQYDVNQSLKSVHSRCTGLNRYCTF